MKTTITGTGTETSRVIKGLLALLLFFTTPVLAQNPAASFTSNTFIGCAPLSVDFTNLSTNATNYFWDFGNGNTSVLQDPSTVYLTPGFYTVTLVAINTANGQSDTLVATNYINVVDDPFPDFTASPLTGCAGNNLIVFTNLSTNAISYIWDFGDGTFSTQSNPSHTYANPGVYTVKLIARNAYNCTKVMVRTAYITITPNPPASFTVNQQSSCDPTTVFNFNATTPGAVAWQWNFGDGNIAAIQNPSHVYGVQGTYDVTLIVTNASGCTDTLVQPAYINIGATLVPSFTVNAQAGCPPFTSMFDCTVPNATSWSWDFGNGNTSNLQNPSNLYATPGVYDVTLSVTTTSGCNGSITYPAFITVDAIPVPDFVVTPSFGCVPVTVGFSNTSTAGFSYSWDLGNGTTSTDVNPSTIYTTAGVYPVTLIATSVNGCTDSLTISTAVTAYDLTATINGTPRTGCAPLSVVVNGTSTPGAVSWFWDFGDGTTGSGASVPHVYNAIGNYTVTLIATSANGCTDTVIRPAFFKVVDDTTIYTVPDTMIVCLPPGGVSFTDPTIGSNSWIWYWGNGDSSTVKNPSYTYTAPGFYTVSLITGMAGGCTQIINPIAYVEVVPFIVSPITSLVVSPCAPYTVQLDNLTPGVLSYLWNFGDGTTSTLQDPVHVYANPGTYSISLLITSINGCLTSLNTTVTFGHNNPISLSVDSMCLGTPVTFALNPAVAFTSASWDFGNGNTSNLLSPVYTYPAVGNYIVSVTVTDTNGCVYTYTHQPVQVSNPQASFVVNQPLVGCAPLDIQFDNTSVGAVSYLWDFGDGNTSSQVSPSHTYSAAGVYTVTLTASAPGCDDVVTQVDYITVNAAVANFSFTPTSGCLPLTVTFTDLSINPVSWFWDFGDGNTSTAQNPVHTFIIEPTGMISLTIVDSNGCSRTRRRANVVVMKPDISANDSIGCRPLTVAFTTTFAAASYLWDFGDGATSAIQNPIHTYTVTGTYTVSLTCVLASGCNATVVKPNYIQVSAPVSDFMSPTSAVCAPSLVNFVNLSTGSTSWLWDFGDGSSSNAQDPAHIYNSPGTYTITLISFSSNGCSDTMVKPDYIIVPGTLASFVPSDTIACENTLIQFSDLSMNASQWVWDFGDGNTSTQQNPGHVYLTAGSYTVTLITNDSLGCSSFYTYPSQILINALPVAAASLTTVVGCSPFTTSFGNTSTGASTYLWDFGDGGSSTDSIPTYTYTNPGVYQVSLIAITAAGCSDTVQIPGNITVNTTPVARFLRSVNSGCEPLSVSFTNQSTSLNGAVYAWDFGNGQTSTAQDPSMVFVTSGVYVVSLTVTNTGGCTSTYTRNITVLARPVALASASGTTGCTPYQVTFTNNSTGANTYAWDFGNGTISGTASPTASYTTAGIFNVSLIAIAANGCTDTLLMPVPITVNQTPTAAFSRNPSSGCVPVTVVVNDNSSQLNNPTYSWNFGNGQTSTLQNTSVTYTIPGTYDITLYVTNQGGCTDSITRTVNARAIPVAAASLSDTVSCGPMTVDFTNNSTGANSYTWDFGDGATSTAVSPSHNYSTAGIYSITLIATNSFGCSDTLVLPNQVNIKIKPVATFTTSPASGCTPMQVVLTNTSTQLQSPSWSWNLGNGTTSSQQTPTISYTTGGTYLITLLVTNNNGCADSTFLQVIANDNPVASGSTNDTSGCHPHTADFTSNSQFGTSVLWMFGDGTTSTSTSPSHTYAQPGVYTVTLVVTGAGGCSDTLILPKPIRVYMQPNASFTASTLSGCTSLNVSFNNTSTQLDNPAYFWDFGDGTGSSQPNPSTTYTLDGVYSVELMVINLGGCADSAEVSIDSDITPVATGTMNVPQNCSPVNVSFSNQSQNSTSWLWVFGDGTSSNQQNPQHTYTASGNFAPYLVAWSAEGCVDTFFFATSIQVNSLPVAGFTVNQTAGCAGSQFAFTNTSTPATGLTYQWNIAGSLYAIANPTVMLTTPGVYGVSLIVTNAAGCTDTLIEPNYIQVYDSVPPPVSPILSVSVASDTEVEIIWQNSASLDLGAYVLYRLNPVTGLFVEIYRDNNPMNSSTNVTSVYTDPGLNTLSNTYTYVLETIDVCNNTLPLSVLTPHRTINVSATPAGQLIVVQWTPYSGCPVGSYEINRTDQSGGASQLIATVPAGTTNYVDTTLYCPGLYSYRITATSLCGTTYISLSDTASAIPSSVLSGQVVEVVRSTVINDSEVLTEWLPPTIAPDRVIEYNIYRSTDNSSFVFITSVPVGALSYIDSDVDVHSQNYYYRIEVINDCQAQGHFSNRSSSILLQSEYDRDQAHLWWSEYIYWGTGVDYYIIEQETQPGIWDPVKTVPGNILDTTVDY